MQMYSLQFTPGRFIANLVPPALSVMPSAPGAPSQGRSAQLRVLATGRVDRGRQPGTAVMAQDSLLVTVGGGGKKRLLSAEQGSGPWRQEFTWRGEASPQGTRTGPLPQISNVAALSPAVLPKEAVSV